MESFTLSLSIKCPGCEHPLPVNRLEEAVECRACGHQVQLTAERWVELFGPEIWPEALALEAGQGYQIQVWGRYNAKVSYGHRAPRCQDCEAELGSELSQDLDCPGCSRRIRVRAADELVRAVVPFAAHVVGEAWKGPSVSSAQPVLFGCLACGAGLSVDGGARTVRCTHCGRDSYLPDELWRRFNPVEKVRVFFVLADIGPEERDELCLRSGDDEVRARLAASTTRPELLRALADDDSSQVKEALCANPACTDAVLLRLVGDHAEELARRPNLSLSLMEAIAASSDWRARLELAKRPDLPLELLEGLRGDSDGDVVEAVVSHPTWREAHPVKAAVEARGVASDRLALVLGLTLLAVAGVAGLIYAS